MGSGLLRKVLGYRTRGEIVSRRRGIHGEGNSRSGEGRGTPQNVVAAESLRG